MGFELFVSVSVLFFLILGKVMIFNKLNEKEWKAFIPIYSDYILFKDIWNKGKFFQYLLLNAGIFILCGITYDLYISSAFPFITYTCMFILSILVVYHLVICLQLFHRMAISFGHGAGYTAGLFFLEPIFLLLIGCDENNFVRT